MEPINQKSPIQNAETLFREQLHSLSQKGVLNGNVLVRQATPLNSILNAIKKTLGYQDLAHQRLVELKTLQFLTEGRQWIKTPEDIELVKTLAKKLGLTQSNKNHPSELLTLIHEICSPVQLQNPSLKEEQKNEENQGETLSDDQTASTSQEDSNPQENPAKSTNINPSNELPATNEIINPFLLVIPESQSTHEPTQTSIQPATSPNTESSNEKKAVSAKVLERNKNRKWSPAVKTALAATSVITTLGLSYLAYQSMGTNSTPPIPTIVTQIIPPVTKAITSSIPADLVGTSDTVAALLLRFIPLFPAIATIIVAAKTFIFKSDPDENHSTNPTDQKNQLLVQNSIPIKSTGDSKNNTSRSSSKSSSSSDETKPEEDNNGDGKPQVKDDLRTNKSRSNSQSSSSSDETKPEEDNNENGKPQVNDDLRTNKSRSSTQSSSSSDEIKPTETTKADFVVVNEKLEPTNESEKQSPLQTAEKELVNEKQNIQVPSTITDENHPIDPTEDSKEQSVLQTDEKKLINEIHLTDDSKKIKSRSSSQSSSSSDETTSEKDNNEDGKLQVNDKNNKSQSNSKSSSSSDEIESDVDNNEDDQPLVDNVSKNNKSRSDKRFRSRSEPPSTRSRSELQSDSKSKIEIKEENTISVLSLLEETTQEDENGSTDSTEETKYTQKFDFSFTSEKEVLSDVFFQSNFFESSNLLEKQPQNENPIKPIDQKLQPTISDENQSKEPTYQANKTKYSQKSHSQIPSEQNEVLDTFFEITKLENSDPSEKRLEHGYLYLKRLGSGLDPLSLNFQEKSIVIPFNDYEKFKGKECDHKKAYTAILMLNQYLNQLKDTHYDSIKGEIRKNHKTSNNKWNDIFSENKQLENELSFIHRALESLERDKKRLFNARFEELKTTKPNIETAFSTFQTVVGDCFIPIDYKMALLEFMDHNPDHEKHIIKYLILASNPHEFIQANSLGTSSFGLSGLSLSTLGGKDLSQMTCLEALPLFFKTRLESAANTFKQIECEKDREREFGEDGELGSEKDESSEDGDDDLETRKTIADFRGSELFSNFAKMNLFLCSKVGALNHSDLITHSIVINKMNSETEETKRHFDAIQKEIAFLPYTPETKHSQQGYCSYEQYGIKVKNDWINKENVFVCTNSIAIKQKDGSYGKPFTNEITLDCEKIKHLIADHANAVIQFIQIYCQCNDFKRLQLEELKYSSMIHRDLKHAMVNDASFWKWSDEGATDKREDFIEYCEKVKNDYTALINLCKEFSKNIDQIFKNALVVEPAVDKQPLNQSSLPSLSNSQIDAKNDLDKDDGDEEEIKDKKDDNDEKEEINIDKKAIESSDLSEAPQSFFSMLGTYATTISDTVSIGVGKVTSTVSNVTTAVAEAFRERDWVIGKFDHSVSNLFKKFRENEALSDFITQNEKNDELAILVNKIFESENNKINPARNNHTNFITNLRAVLDSPLFKDALANTKLDINPNSDEHNQLVKVVLEICRIRFEEGHFFEFFNKTMNETFGLKEEESYKLHENDFTILENLHYDHQMFKPEVISGCLAGHFNINFDPHLNGNIPYLFGTLRVNGRDIKLLRTGSPTMEGFVEKAKIIPEFKVYLESLLIQGKNHLYISLQNDKSKWMGTGDETARNRVIKELQKEYKNFFAVVLAQDSRFYKQADFEVDKDGNEIPQQSTQFLNKFYDEMFGYNTGFYFPQAWKDDPAFKKNIRILLRFVHTVIFNDSNKYQTKPLSRQERLDFIEIFYAYLSVFLMHYSNADNANISCKDAIDRAGKLNSLLLQLLLIIEGNAMEPKYQRVHQVLTHMGAMWVKGKAILHSRRDRLLSAFELMCNKNTINRIKTYKLFALDQDGKFTVPLINPKYPMKFEIDFDSFMNKKALIKPESIPQLENKADLEMLKEVVEFTKEPIKIESKLVQEENEIANDAIKVLEGNG